MTLMILILKNSLVCNNASDDDDEPNRLCDGGLGIGHMMHSVHHVSYSRPLKAAQLLRLHSSNVSSSRCIVALVAIV